MLSKECCLFAYKIELLLRIQDLARLRIDIQRPYLADGAVYGR